MAESPSPSSPKALTSLNYSSSPSPITSLGQQIGYDNYQPYVLVKGLMEAPEKARRGTEVPVKARGGIALDEASTETSSNPIPSKASPQSIGNELTCYQSISLPSSPTKVEVKENRRLEELRDAIQKMKDASNLDEPTDMPLEPSYNHLPTELRHTDGYSLHEQHIELSRPQGMSHNLNSISSNEDRRLMKTHGVFNVPHVLETSGHYPVNSIPQRSKTPFKVKPPNLLLPPFQHPSAKNQKSSQYPLDNKETSPPTLPNSNQNHSPVCHYLLHDTTTDFPPLHGTQLETKCQLPIPKEPNSPKTKLPSPWNQLFASNRVKANGESLNYVPNLSQANNPTITISPEEVSAELTRWKNALVGHVIGAKPPYKLMQQFVDKRWKAFGKVELFILRAGLFIFNFQDEDTKAKILEMGPWSYFDKPLILKPWTSKENYDTDELEKIPIWVRFPHLKLHLWSATTLSKIGSLIGIPMFTDRMTAQRERLAYARICVEVNTNSTFPTSLDIMDHDGTLIKQNVEYEWIPAVCEGCKQLGHKAAQCTKKVKKEWRPVPKANYKEEASSSKIQKESQQMEPQFTKAMAKEKDFQGVKEGEQPLKASSQATQAEALSTSNKYELLAIDSGKEALSISPLAIVAATMEEHSNVEAIHQASPKKLELQANNSPRPEDVSLKEVQPQPKQEMSSNPQLSNSQKKKLNKMQFAEEHKAKASKAKSRISSPSLS